MIPESADTVPAMIQPNESVIPRERAAAYNFQLQISTNHSTRFVRETMTFKEINVDVPNHDCDILIRLPGGKILTVQLRPSNADVKYNGSLDILLPENQLVTCWEGLDMDDAKAPDASRPHERICQQLVMELPAEYPAF